ncbi:MAG TPA: site-specific integrase [Verrucomicrobiota bacterium]|nr:site-specific integrase [Verrucomicrobiota bacterium]HPY31364.1 site-specific integrase [Verrucomicrobiota bacterium]HQB17944.1 site-specific integrase [Verrucomicrobiota bacterium]
MPHLLQYEPTAMYYARVKVGGKLVRRSLKTDVYSKALLRLNDFLKQQRSAPPRRVDAPITFADARLRFEQALQARHDLKPRSKVYRQGCVKALLKTWPGLDALKLASISESDCNEWAKRFREAGYDEHYFNQALSTLRHILDYGELHSNPTRKVKRLGVKMRELKLPEPDQFMKLIANLEQGGGRASRHCADLVRFLAFSGCRLSEAKEVTWKDVDLPKGTLKVMNAKVRMTSGAKRHRAVPIIADMRILLERLKESNPAPDETVCRVHECQKALTRACQALNIARITHHDLRHLFATRCIESGVDIPTVSRWLGHGDGGALAMRVYGHLRDKHSAEMATKVTFAAVGDPAGKHTTSGDTQPPAVPQAGAKSD